MADCNGIKIINLAEKTALDNDDFLVITDSDVGNVVKKAKAGNFTDVVNRSELISTDAGNIITTGVDGNLFAEETSPVSTDVNNEIIEGSDGKAYYQQTLTENTINVGNSSNLPEEKTFSQVSNLLGLPFNYNDSSIERISTTQVTWQGRVRDDNNEFDIIDIGGVSANTTATVAVPAAFAKWYLFVGFDNNVDKNVYAEFASDTSGTGLVNITGAKRLLLNGNAVLSDSSGDLSAFDYNGGYYEVDLWTGLLAVGSATLSDDFTNYDAINKTVTTSLNNLVASNRFTVAAIEDGNASGRARVGYSTAASDGYVDFAIIPSNTLNVVGVGGTARAKKLTGIVYNAK